MDARDAATLGFAMDDYGMSNTWEVAGLDGEHSDGRRGGREEGKRQEMTREEAGTHPDAIRWIYKY